MAEITVIVPLYNVVQYLPECVESILRQTFQDFELLLLDDGSTDGSGALCDSYAQEYPNVRVLHQARIGVAETRNRGVAESRSEYIVFIDSDDFVDRRYLETLYETAEAYRADLVLSGIINILDGACPPAAGQKPKSPPEIISTEEAYRRTLLGRDVSVTATSKIYRKNMLENVYFPEVEISEDAAVLAQILDSCAAIVYIDYAGYYYRRRLGSLMHSGMSEGQFAAVRNAKQLLDHVREHYPKASGAARVFYINNLLQIMNYMVVDPEERWREKCRAVRREILQNAAFFLFNRDALLVEKIAVLSLLPGVPFYRFAWHVYLRLTGKIHSTMTPDKKRGGGQAD